MDISSQDPNDWDDLLGTGTVLKKLIKPGQPQPIDEDEEIQTLEAPRNFFALINIQTKCNDKIVDTESHRNFLINIDADLFPGAHLVIPLMEIGEESRYIFDPKFAYGEEGNGPHIPPNAKLECLIELILRCPYNEFLSRLSPEERLDIAGRKKERGKFWFSKGNIHNAVSIYKSLTDICKFNPDESAD